MAIYDDIILKVAREAEAELETRLASDVMYFNSEIRLSIFSWFRDVVEKLAHRAGKRDAISVCLTTTGGQAEAVEKLVEVIRHHYGLVYFVVPFAAMSAGLLHVWRQDLHGLFRLTWPD